jgi:hypothetical protein
LQEKNNKFTKANHKKLLKKSETLKSDILDSPTHHLKSMINKKSTLRLQEACNPNHKENELKRMQTLISEKQELQKLSSKEQIEPLPPSSPQKRRKSTFDKSPTQHIQANSPIQQSNNKIEVKSNFESSTSVLCKSSSVPSSPTLSPLNINNSQSLLSDSFSSQEDIPLPNNQNQKERNGGICIKHGKVVKVKRKTQSQWFQYLDKKSAAHAFKSNLRNSREDAPLLSSKEGVVHYEITLELKQQNLKKMLNKKKIKIKDLLNENNALYNELRKRHDVSIMKLTLS